MKGMRVVGNGVVEPGSRGYEGSGGIGVVEV